MLLSIGMIVKNEEKTLRECLNGIRPLTERPDVELVIADTGSADGTASVAREFTDKVFEVKWENDFAKARNATLERAGGEWFMFLDADEVFRDVSDIIDFFDSGEYRRYGCASYIRHNGGEADSDVVTRLYKLEKYTAFQGRIHEQIPLQPPVKRLKSACFHTGYDFNGAGGREKRAVKHRRNIKPLLEMHAENPEDLRIIALTANEYLTSDKYDEALRFVYKGLALCGKSQEDMFYHILRHYELYCLCRTSEYEKAADRAGDYFKAARKLFTCAVNMRMAEGLAFTKLGRPKDALNSYEEAGRLLKAHESGELDDGDIAMSVMSNPHPGMGEFIAGSAQRLRAFIDLADKAGAAKTSGDAYGYISFLREGVKSAPEMGEAVLKLINAAEREREEARIRLDKEAAAIKDAVFGLIESGRAGTARGVLERYAQANPSDTDIKAIEKIIERAEADESLPGKIALMRKVTAVFALSDINVGGTGVVNSVLNKARLMEERWGCGPVILTCGHNIELRRVERVLRGGDSGKVRLGKNTRVISVYELLQNSYGPGLENKALYLNPNDGVKRVQTEDGIYEVYEDGEIVRREYYTGYEGALRAVMALEGGRNRSLTFYDDWGYVSKVCRYATEYESRLDYTEFHNTGGWVCVKAVYGGGSAPEKLILYDEKGETAGEFSDDAGLAALCLNGIIDDEGRVLLVVEDGLMTADIENIQKKNLAKGVVVHTVFLENPYDSMSEPNVHYKYLCENPGSFDGIVFTTGKAREDFCGRFGAGERTFVIPHPYPHEIIRADFERRDHRKAVIVTRFDIVKQVDLAIDIFALAVRELPDIRLEIYGFGDLREEYVKHIARLGLERNVFLMGHAGDPSAVFGGAAMSMMTSLAEGFGITMAESLCCGCPVFAFDIKYGPSDIITDGETGYLFKAFDKEAFVRKMVRYFEDIGLQKTMSERCYGKAGRFGAGAFLEGWYGMTAAVFGAGK